MPRPCTSCTHPKRAELDRRLRSGATLPDVARWSVDNPPAVGVNALGRHRADHLGLALTPPGPRPLSDDFAQAVRDAAHEDLRSGALRPNLTQGLQATKILDDRDARFEDRDLMIRIAMALTGSIQAGGASPAIEAYEASGQAETVRELEAEFQELLPKADRPAQIPAVVYTREQRLADAKARDRR